MSCIPQLTQTLRARGYRMTPQRLSILQALHDGGHLSPTQIYERVHQTGMTETTVYRTLDEAVQAAPAQAVFDIAVPASASA